MIFGWITRNKYVEHYDPERWHAGEEGSQPAPAKSPEAVI
jgi:hypothetical protein